MSKFYRLVGLRNYEDLPIFYYDFIWKFLVVMLVLQLLLAHCNEEEECDITFSKFNDENVLKTREKHELIRSVPPFIHRLLLFDEFIPLNVMPYVDLSMRQIPKFVHILWREADLLQIMSDSESKVYFKYQRRIQKADFGRYIILLHYGGIYIDLDVELLKPSALLQYQHIYPETENVFFEEVTLIEEETLAGSNSHPIRQGMPETSLRIANFLIISVAKSSCMESIIDLCQQRQQNVYEDYDVL